MCLHILRLAGGQQAGSKYGTIGDICTDELLARRRQRQQAEKQAQMAVKRTNSFARRPMAPVQPLSYHQRPVQASKADVGSAIAATSKRLLDTSLLTSAATTEEPAGVSADELVKVNGPCCIMPAAVSAAWTVMFQPGGLLCLSVICPTTL